MKHLGQYLVIVMSLGLSLNGRELAAQITPLAGTKICIDPGHGGHDSNDRETDLGIGTLYYESDATWESVGFLDSLLQKLGAEVKVTRTTNDPAAEDRDPSLSDRVAVANGFAADYFHSFHTNGSDNKLANYSLVLYAGPADGSADSPEALEMAEIMDDYLYDYMETTNTFARADIPFTGFTNGLGVLNNLNMPGTLSECSFHSHVNEGRRLMNSEYRKAAAWAIVKSFLDYFEQPQLSVGEIGGVVTNQLGAAVNGVKVTLNKGEVTEKVYMIDDYLNGFYFYDWLAPGEYTLTFEKEGHETENRNVTAIAGGYLDEDIILVDLNLAPLSPTLTSIVSPDSEEGVIATWTTDNSNGVFGYRLYYALDDDLENWSLVADEETINSASTSISVSKSEFKVVPTDNVYHFRLTAVSQSGNESEYGDVYSLSPPGTALDILIVDGLDRINGSYTQAVHSFTTDYLVALRDAGTWSMASAANEAVRSGTISLADYDVAVWFLGDESTADETLDDEEQAKLQTFLEGGGKLIISGSEIGWDLGNKGTATDKAFYQDYLKSLYVGDGNSQNSPATGIEGTAFEGLSIPFGISYPEDYPDDIAPAGGSHAILNYNLEGKFGGVAFKGTFGQGTAEGGVVYISFPLETAEAANQKAFIKKAVDYLTTEPEVLFAQEKSKISASLFPNPTANEAMLEVLFSGQKSQSVNISIMDYNGKEVIPIISNTLVSGKNQIALSTDGLNPGLYLILVANEEEIYSLKLIRE